MSRVVKLSYSLPGSHYSTLWLKLYLIITSHTVISTLTNTTLNMNKVSTGMLLISIGQNPMFLSLKCGLPSRLFCKCIMVKRLVKIACLSPSVD